MKKIFLWALAILCAQVSFCQDNIKLDSYAAGYNFNWYRFYENGKVGALDSQGNIIIPAIYSRVGWGHADDLMYFTAESPSGYYALFNKYGKELISTDQHYTYINIDYISSNHRKFIICKDNINKSACLLDINLNRLFYGSYEYIFIRDVEHNGKIYYGYTAYDYNDNKYTFDSYGNNSYGSLPKIINGNICLGRWVGDDLIRTGNISSNYTRQILSLPNSNIWEAKPQSNTKKSSLINFVPENYKHYHIIGSVTQMSNSGESNSAIEDIDFVFVQQGNKYSLVWAEGDESGNVKEIEIKHLVKDEVDESGLQWYLDEVGLCKYAFAYEEINKHYIIFENTLDIVMTMYLFKGKPSSTPFLNQM